MLQIQQNVYISINFHTPTHPYNTQLTKLAYCIMQSYLLDFNSKLSYTPNSPIPTTQNIKLPPPHPTPNTTLLLTPWLYWSPPSTQYSHWPPPPTDTHPWLYNSIPPNPPTPNTTHILIPGLCLSLPSILLGPHHNTAQILTRKLC